jgi:RNA polymerase sigma-70 factor (ECF subfamily)
LSELVEIKPLVDHLFRHESGKLVAILTCIFGTEHIELAEDVVQDSLLKALDQWRYNGVPDNPSGWLFRVAKNKALNLLEREKYKRNYVKQVSDNLRSEQSTGSETDFFSNKWIQDDQLRMIFICCHPAISPDSQIALALKTLCGFSISEIAKAFLTTEENINKRLVRARQNIRDAKIPFEIPHAKEVDKRLNTMLETIYLLFNEGYSASKGNDVIRYELCEEAIRLAQIVLDNNSFDSKENVHALLGLMFLNASRFKARQDAEGNLLTMEQQDRSVWDKQMRAVGLFHLAEAFKNESIGVYHILAAISAQYSIALDYESTDWKNILSLYDSLIQLDKSPVVLLNRAIVVSKVNGSKQALAELQKIKHDPSLKNYYLYHSTQAEFFTELNEFAKAIMSLEKATQLAPLQSERELFKKKIDALKRKVT